MKDKISGLDVLITGEIEKVVDLPSIDMKDSAAAAKAVNWFLTSIQLMSQDSLLVRGVLTVDETASGLFWGYLAERMAFSTKKSKMNYGREISYNYEYEGIGLLVASVEFWITVDIELVDTNEVIKEIKWKVS